MKYTIDKTFHFEAGHRVWAQKLNNPELSISTECACRHMHGHSYKLKVFLTADYLDQSSMVTDFKNLNFVKAFIDGNLDHKFILDINDPNFERITGVNPNKVNFTCNFSNLGDQFTFEDADEQTHINGFVLVNFVPTSENLCRYIGEYIENQIRDVAKVEAVELWETEKSHCRVIV